MNDTLPIYKDLSHTIAERVHDLMARMTLDEKIAQLGSCWVYQLQDEHGLSEPHAAAWMGQGIGQITRVGGGSTLAPVESAKMANAIQAYLVHQTRLGIPAIVHEECCGGYMALGATCFPQIIGLASTWMPELAEQMTNVIRAQMRAVGAHQGLAPVLDVARDPRWGRVEETFGEDPLLASQMGIAYVRGLQGDSLRDGVMATGKHFLGHGISEAGMNCTPVHIGPRELRDVILMPFQAVVQEAHLASMMNAYSELDGVVVASSRAILTDLLRGEIGFDGPVVSDYRAISMLYDFHHVAADEAHAAHLALNAGIDVELPETKCNGAPLRQAVKSGLVHEELLNTSVERILRKKFELGLFENPYVAVERVMAVYETPAQRQLARRIAEQSIVLLKNDGDVLPLAKTIKSIAVIGPNANQARHLLGDYTHPAHVETLLEGHPELATRLKCDPQSNGIVPGTVQIHTILDAIREKVSPDTRVLFAPGCAVNDADKSGFDQAVQAAQQAEVVVLVVGDKSGLSLNCTSGESRDRAELGLPGAQQELVQAIAALGKPTVVVLVNGRPLAIPWIAEHIPAVVEAWLPGEEGGAAVANVLFGDVNPGGKLTMTWARAVGQIPTFYNHKPSGGRSTWHTDYVELPVTPLFPFGHGLSCTKFEYSNLKIDAADACVTISADIKNVGQRAGDEVMQLYIRDEVASAPRPVKELKGFQRVGLAPGETRAIVFELPLDLLAFHDEAMQLVVEPGTIQVMIGSSSHDIRLNGSFVISGPKRMVARRIFGCATRVQ
ncbi:MAG: glycoside hydrolase family 3 C-terminal domain-containing protein [Chloroflexi bacterium]|nr:glycoside hydrolase family 3 C-terminal domain-containing protein [Chloroflexota bacterium]